MDNSEEIINQKPEKIFHGQWDTEKVEMVVRKHWMAYFSTIIIMVGLFCFSFFFMYIFISEINFSGNELTAFHLVLGIYYLIILTFGLATWVDYYFDIIIITDQRLISIQQKGLFVRGIDGLSLLRIQNVSAESKGILQIMFNYGFAYAETAGEQSSEEIKSKVGTFSFDFIPDPYNFSEKIMRLHDALLINGTHRNQFAVGEGDLQSNKEISKNLSLNNSKPISKLGEIASGDISQKDISEIFDDDNYPNEPDI